MKFILDFDRVIFDMDALYTEISHTNPTAKLGTIESLDGIALHKFLFPDAVDFFVQHQKETIEVVSSCFGKTGTWDLEYQREKVKRSGVAQFVHTVQVVEKDKVTVLRNVPKTERTVFVDDHPENAQAVAEALPQITVLYLDRTGENKTPANTTRITSLADVDAIIESL